MSDPAKNLKGNDRRKAVRRACLKLILQEIESFSKNDLLRLIDYKAGHPDLGDERLYRFKELLNTLRLNRTR